MEASPRSASEQATRSAQPAAAFADDPVHAEGEQTGAFLDPRPAAVTQRMLLGRMAHSPTVQRMAMIQASVDDSPVGAAQRRRIDHVGRPARTLDLAGSAPVQRYFDGHSKGGPKYRVSDNKGIAVEQSQSEGGQDLSAKKELMDSANEKLLAEKSAIELVPGPNGTMDCGAGELIDVRPTIRDLDPSKDDTESTERLKGANREGEEQQEDSEGVADSTLAMFTDCGRCSRVVTGGMVAAVYRAGEISKRSLVSTDPAAFSDSVYSQVIAPFWQSDISSPFLKEGIHYTVDPDDPKQWLSLAPTDAAGARRMYWELGEEGRMAFDRFAGINTFANPEIGSTYAIVSEKKMPGFARKGFTWNFHWAGVVMKDGGDNLTLEGYAVMAGEQEIKELKEKYSGEELETKLKELKAKYASWINRSWVLQMYGTKKLGQTFHEQHLASGTHGTRATTMVGKK